MFPVLQSYYAFTYETLIEYLRQRIGTQYEYAQVREALVGAMYLMTSWKSVSSETLEEMVTVVAETLTGKYRAASTISETEMSLQVLSDCFVEFRSER